MTKPNNRRRQNGEGNSVVPVWVGSKSEANKRERRDGGDSSLGFELSWSASIRIDLRRFEHVGAS